LPVITNDRYRSVKLDKNFKIHVFSEDRSDFVSLEQLSSGTNDLLMLVLQIFLVHSFTESVDADKNFVFFDEPLLAVDSERYSRFIDLATSISPKIKQIFLCRPPENFDTQYSINTQLEKNTLIQDFSA
jgi:DNA repair protein SbcC/Rad50